MLLEGIKNDARYLLFLFWRGCMRACGALDRLMVRWHDACLIRAERLDRRSDG